jgi:hypothetical protein
MKRFSIHLDDVTTDDVTTLAAMLLECLRIVFFPILQKSASISSSGAPYIKYITMRSMQAAVARLQGECVCLFSQAVIVVASKKFIVLLSFSLLR